jgi:hypothetical protein
MEQAMSVEGSTCGVLVGRRKLMSEEEQEQRVPVEPDTGPFSPVWMLSPPPRPDDVGIINYDFRVNSVFRNAVDYISDSKLPTFLDVCNYASLFDKHEYGDRLQTAMVFPVFDGYDRETSNVVGNLIAIVPWDVFYRDILLQGSPPVIAVHENTCHQVFTFELHGHYGELLAEEDVHEEAFEDMVVRSSHSHLEDHGDYYEDLDGVNDEDGGTTAIATTTNSDARTRALEDEFYDEQESRHIDNRTCSYTIAVYPTKEFQDTHITTDPILFACMVLAVFLLTSLLFVVFDRIVRKRTEKVMSVALKQNAIVSSLFPKSVQAKLMAEADQNEKLGKLGKAGIKSFLNANTALGEPNNDATVAKSKPIAGRYSS